MGCEPAVVNGGPAPAAGPEGELEGVMALRVEDGLVTGLCCVRCSGS
ncbi:hypothetical protein [Streptomyces brevispora]|uniref:Uncharacterized protein n=1 Tax=Streptomyces brevispora TaxID=887462 RepID=A0ABZ1FVB1_9ACTN|nr:hypothetical protein [Streptomyces brevispora]WSC11524.1 hypothetical protein OIE64_00615 [Streptomyces brevispora]WSC17587.1 hypothetical protein OIE64_35425 [Streptomyces brevispora]